MRLSIDEVTGSKTYVAGDFSTDVPLMILVEPSDSAEVVLTFPASSEHGLSANEAKILGFIWVGNSRGAVAVQTADNTLRSQPGTDGWDPNLNKVYLGRTLALADESPHTVMVDGRRGLTTVTGQLRAHP